MAEMSKELKQALFEIEKAAGKDAIMRLGDRTSEEIQGISTGSLSLDLALGGKGVPRGRVIEIFGQEASGKTTIALHTVAAAQKAGGVAAYIDVEHSLDPSWAKRLGVNLEDLLVSQPNYAEEALKIVELLVASRAVDVIVVDSVAALVPRAEVENDIGELQVGLHARLMSQALRILNPQIAKTNTCLIFINQMRQKVGVFFGSPDTTPGGLALKFYASVRMKVERTGAVKKSDEVVGSEVRVKVVKNKVAPPFKQADFHIMYDSGISREGDVLLMALDEKIIEKQSAGRLFYGTTALGTTEKAKDFLRENPALADELVQKILQKRGVAGAVMAVDVGDHDGEEEEEEAPVAPAPKAKKGRQAAGTNE
jgi:recombination protein RecA